MIHREAQKHAEKCRFCWMCRHLCPVQLFTGKEINTPRAKGLLLSMVERGAEFDADMAKTMYECLLCEACTNDCATGYNPPLFIREARSEAVVRDLVPENVQAVIDNVLNTGNIYGEKKPSYGKEAGGDVLVYVGEVAAIKVPAMVNAFLSLLDKAEVSYTVLPEEPASGVMLGDLIGYTGEVQEMAKACADRINAAGTKKVVCLDSYDAQIMAEKYKEWGCPINAPVQTATALIAGLLTEGRLMTGTPAGAKAAYHDDDRLARFFREYEPGREIAKAAGFEPIEMFNKYDLAKSSGTSVAKAYMPEIIAGIAAGRWDDLKRTEARVLLTANPEAYECLSSAIPAGYELVDLYEALDNAVR